MHSFQMKLAFVVYNIPMNEIPMSSKLDFKRAIDRQMKLNMKYRSGSYERCHLFDFALVPTKWF